jgi:NACalpha-BTF3-like transcription factor
MTKTKSMTIDELKRQAEQLILILQKIDNVNQINIIKNGKTQLVIMLPARLQAMYEQIDELESEVAFLESDFFDAQEALDKQQNKNTPTNDDEVNAYTYHDGMWMPKSLFD